VGLSQTGDAETWRKAKPHLRPGKAYGHA
jgi:hypothetical protein